MALKMKAPPHPGRTIRNACLEPLGLSVTEGAKVLGVARPTLSRGHQRQGFHFAGNGDQARQGFREQSGNMD